MGRPIKDAVEVVLGETGLGQTISTEQYTQEYIQLIEECMADSEGHFI
jgi:hypothetical protein